MTNSHENIERLANMLREDLQLSVPITASALQSAMQKQLNNISRRVRMLKTSQIFCKRISYPNISNFVSCMIHHRKPSCT